MAPGTEAPRHLLHALLGYIAGVAMGMSRRGCAGVHSCLRTHRGPTHVPILTSVCSHRAFAQMCNVNCVCSHTRKGACCILYRHTHACAHARTHTHTRACTHAHMHAGMHHPNTGGCPDHTLDAHSSAQIQGTGTLFWAAPSFLSHPRSPGL